MNNLVPTGPPALPGVGHAPWFLRDKPRFLLECHRRYGDVVRLQLGGPTFLVVSPADLRHILSTRADNYGKSPRITGATARHTLGANVLTVEGADHRRLRQALRPWVHPSVLDPLPPYLAKRAGSYAAQWISEGQFDIGTAALGLASECVATALLGPSVCERHPDLGMLLDARRRYLETLFGLWPHHLTRAAFTYPAAHRSLLRILDDLVSESGPSHPVVSSHHAPPPALSVVEQREQLLTLLVAGYETTAAMLAWSFYLLAAHPQIQRAARETTYATQSIREALRLYPPTWLFVRIARSSDRLPSGAAIPAGAKIYLSQFVSHRQATIFADPERFDPSRFANGNRFDPFAYFPFGGGPRMCPGEEMAISIGVGLITNLTQKIELRLVTDQPPAFRSGLTLYPARPIRVRVRRRTD